MQFVEQRIKAFVLGNRNARRLIRSPGSAFHPLGILYFLSSSSTEDHLDQGKLNQVLDALDRGAIQANTGDYIQLLQACCNDKSLSAGKRVHAHIIKSTAGGIEQNVTIGNLLVHMYIKCRSVTEARRVFDKMPERSVILWTAMIAANARCGDTKEALRLFWQMQLNGVAPNSVTFTALLDGCFRPEALPVGKLIHGWIRQCGLESHVAVVNSLIHMYGKCGSLIDARSLFDGVGSDQQNVVSWTSMVAAYARNGHYKKALQLFQQMQLVGVMPDYVAFVAVLEACDDLPALKLVHSSISEKGFNSGLVIGNALVSMYSKCGSLQDARAVFHRMPRRDVISWNAMLRACAQHSQGGQEVLQLYQQMKLESIPPSEITFITVLDVCSSGELLAEGRQIHAEVVRSGFEADVVVATALVNMYTRCGKLEDARNVFDKTPNRDVVLWTAIITACCQYGCYRDALKVFQQMQLESIRPNEITLVTVLNACACIPALAYGRVIHAWIIEHRIDSFPVGTALVDMYGKCGSLQDARHVFEKLRGGHAAVWNALIAAYAQHGHPLEVFEILERMQHEGVKPDSITFVGILTACNHAGLVSEGCWYYGAMIGDHSLEPLVEHCGCMTDLLGRVGWLDEAEKFIQKMAVAVEPNAVVWTSLLGACKIHGDVRRGRSVAESVVKLEEAPQSSAPYVVLSNIYSDVHEGQRDEPLSSSSS